jgi:PTH1 family peptidyl-tRNA hydrolase
MNDSGLAARDLWRRFKLRDPASLLVVHDELDLEPGVVRVKQGGGLAGHNGLRSIRDYLGTADFLRVRIGIGKPPSREQGAKWVLSRPPKSERALLDEGVRTAAEAVEQIWAKGPSEAMTQFNAR